MWNGKRLLPESWINEATSKHIQSKGGSKKQEENDWQQGYGYQFWRCRHDAYRGDGAFGQYCIVMPKEDMVIAITSETGDMGAILDHVWDHILPAVKTTDLSADKTLQAGLKQKLTALALPLTTGKAASDLLAKVSRKTFDMAENSLKVSRVSLSFNPDSCTFTLTDDKGSHQVAGGIGKWKEGWTDIPVMPLKPRIKL